MRVACQPVTVIKYHFVSFDFTFTIVLCTRLLLQQ